MTDPRPIDIRTFGLCEECGAVVHDEPRHFEWHAAQQPADPVPVPVLDPWEEALAAFHRTPVSWDVHLSAALRWISVCFERTQPGDLVGVAAHIRAMAPEGTRWDEPERFDPERARSVLRTTVRTLIAADDWRGSNPTVNLQDAEACLHGLWLAAREEK